MCKLLSGLVVTTYRYTLRFCRCESPHSITLPWPTDEQIFWQRRGLVIGPWQVLYELTFAGLSLSAACKRIWVFVSLRDRFRRGAGALAEERSRATVVRTEQPRSRELPEEPALMYRHGFGNRTK